MSASCCYCMHACKKKTISQRAPLPPANPCMFNMRQIIWKWYANIYLFWWLRVRTARVGVFKCGERKKKLHFKKFNHLPWGWCLNKTHSERWLQRVHSCSINIVETIMHLLYIYKKNSQNKALAKTLVSEKLFRGNWRCCDQSQSLQIPTFQLFISPPVWPWGLLHNATLFTKIGHTGWKGLHIITKDYQVCWFTEILYQTRSRWRAI